MKKLLCICGSPRRDGNTEILVDKIIENINKKYIKVEKVILNELNISPCQGCQYCHKKGRCIIKDDMQELYNKILNCDYIIVASPIYFRSITSQLKIMIDRCQVFWARKFILNKEIKKEKIGVFISVGGRKDDKEIFNSARSIIKTFFYVTSIKYQYELLVKGVEEKGEILNNKKYLDKAVNVGKKLCLI